MGLSIRAYARQRGVSHVAVLRAIKQGRVLQEPDGTIDPAKADASWERSTDPARAKSKAKLKSDAAKQGGFHLTSTARERIWATPSGKAHFLVYHGLSEDPDPEDSDVLWLTSVRSHDQYNSTLYSLSDHYRGIFWTTRRSIYQRRRN